MIWNKQEFSVGEKMVVMRRAMATIMHGKKILINGAGQMLELGNTPEERINAVNN